MMPKRILASWKAKSSHGRPDASEGLSVLVCADSALWTESFPMRSIAA